MTPLIITQGHRKAIITGNRVRLLKKRNRKPDQGEWPETAVHDPVLRLYVAHAWVIKGILDDDFVKM
jgi:hypothetical protein